MQVLEIGTIVSGLNLSGLGDKLNDLVLKEAETMVGPAKQCLTSDDNRPPGPTPGIVPLA